MRALIVGVNGFVGKFLARELESVKTREVFGIGQEIKTGILPNSKYFCCDIRDFVSLNNIIKKIQPTHIFHLAAISNVQKCAENPFLAIDINVKGFVNVLESLKTNKISARVLFTSSSQVYGSVEKCPIKETFPAQPLNEYSATKACCEILGKQYAYSYGIDVVFVRAFNHFGPGQDVGFVISDFCSQIAAIEKGKKNPEMIVGNLDVFRDFLDVRDIASAYVAGIELCEKGVFYNVCSGEPVLVRDLLNKLLSFSKVSIKIVENPVDILGKNIKEAYGDNSLFEKQTKWKPKTSLEGSLKDTLNFFREKGI